MSGRRRPGARIARALVAVASRLVPQARRAEWVREWEGELWARADAGGPLVGPAFGSFRHALSLRAHAWRGSRVTPWFSRLDVKLAVRMLLKHPGLAVVACLAISVAIAIGAVLEGVASGVHTPLPFEGGERVVALEMVDARFGWHERRILHDFSLWRDELETVEALGAFRLLEENLMAGGGGEPVEVAAITANAFELAGVPPALGRALLPEDEGSGAPAVAVVSHELWQSRFGGDPNVLGRMVQVGTTQRTIVGVMPHGFAFPMNQDLWVPLGTHAVEHAPRRGPEVYLFGRLIPGATLEGARAELSTLGRGAAAAWPDTHEHLRPRVVPYTLQHLEGMGGWLAPVVRTFSTLLLLVICATVATLVYARTATRQGEIAVRCALGASRRRIVGQLFVEALVLTTVAAALGLLMARWALKELDALAEQFMAPAFWFDFGLSARTVLYALGLAALAAVVVGVLPALRATRQDLESRLRELGDGSALRFGKTWTALIVVQVAVAVAALPAAVSLGWTFLTFANREPGYATKEFLVAPLHMDSDFGPAEAEAFRPEDKERFAQLQAELVRRLAAEPGVADVVPLTTVQELGAPTVIEVEGRVREGKPSPSAARTHVVGTTQVAPGFFPAMEVPILAGRGLSAPDADTASTAVVVNRSFVEQVLEGSSPLGRRIRYARRNDTAPVRWYEIVGVVDDFPAQPLEPDMKQAALYHALPEGQLWHFLAVRPRDGAPLAFAPRLREVTASFDPSILVRSTTTLEAAMREGHEAMRFTALALALTAASVLLLSAAGIFALMGFTVAQRHREIGIRAALGASPRRLLLTMFSGAVAPLGAGVLVGAAVAAVLAAGLEPEEGGAAWSVPAVTGLIVLVALAATVLPARRGLAVQPTEALRAE